MTNHCITVRKENVHGRLSGTLKQKESEPCIMEIWLIQEVIVSVLVRGKVLVIVVPG